ncbi:GGDEF domain-containing protein [Dechloromonas sp. A34]|uniref:GGDEF domain-containing protein n=1 Tax=Dechloromonas sp. A34 TaxID=447588 RepID=UPI0022498507|nr:GGDEF domain-containing protein [Dechloromonas sp. A34]
MSRPAVKFGLGGRFTLLLSLFGVLASGLTGYYAYSTSRELLVKAAEQRLLTATQVLVRQLVVTLESSVRDVQLLARHPLPQQALSATSPAARASAESGVDALFASLLETRSEYFQIRLIAADDHGMERVRIDRDGKLLLQVAGDDLQEKSHYPYVFETLRLPPDKVYISSPAINHEEGAHAGLGRPSLHLAMPIHGTGRVLGLVVINIDLDRIFSQLSADLPSEITFMLAGRHGDFLVHPDPAQAFAFDRGQRVLIHDQFPATAALLHGGSGELVTVTGADGPAATVAAFVRYQLPVEHIERAFIIGLVQPLSDVLADSDAVGWATGRIVVAFSVLFVLLAIFLARAVIRPLNQMLRSVECFSSGQTRTPLPVGRQDEIGVLARSVDALQKQVDGQMAELHEKQLELDHLASHDSLTGLPNRRLFLDRLEHTLARARRSGGTLSLLFIDLDQFKEINDRLGHAAGDVVLQAAAERMRGVVREIDTVARLGGDEFIILLDATDDTTVVANVADELLIALAQPVTVGAETLTIGGSVGISSYPRDGATATEIIAAADQAMYRAKNEGRNRFRFACAES